MKCCSECGKLLKLDHEEQLDMESMEPQEIFSFRTSGAARILCKRCKTDAVRRMKKQATPYIVTKGISVHAMNSLGGRK